MPSNLIPVGDAAEMTSNFRSQKESMLTTGLRDAGTLPVCETFDRSAFDTILSDTNCTGVRIYLGMDSDSKVKLIVVGVNSSNEDIMIAYTNPGSELATDYVVEDGTRCPDDCPPSSSLNS